MSYNFEFSLNDISKLACALATSDGQDDFNEKVNALGILNHVQDGKNKESFDLLKFIGDCADGVHGDYVKAAAAVGAGYQVSLDEFLASGAHKH